MWRKIFTWDNCFPGYANCNSSVILVLKDLIFAFQGLCLSGYQARKFYDGNSQKILNTIFDRFWDGQDF